jgi:hypothetical protein
MLVGRGWTAALPFFVALPSTVTVAICPSREKASRVSDCNSPRRSPVMAARL